MQQSDAAQATNFYPKEDEDHYIISDREIFSWAPDSVFGMKLSFNYEIHVFFFDFLNRQYRLNMDDAVRPIDNWIHFAFSFTRDERDER